MAIDPALLECFPHTVQIANVASTDNYGQTSFGSNTAYQARVEKRARLFRDQNGREIVGVATVYLTSAVTISPRARITLPDGTTPPILAVETQPDESGDYYTAIITGNAATSAGSVPTK